MAPPPPELMEELVEEILLRFPPQEPALLVRAALVCKRWRRLVSCPGFRRRFRELHRTPPLLGFLYRGISADGRSIGRFVPTAAFPARRAPGAAAACARLTPATAASSSDGQGNALLPTSSSRSWDPIADEERKLPVLPRSSSRWGAAVLCSAAGDCDHLDCHRRPFLVVVLAANFGGSYVRTYSSDAAAWSEPIFSQQTRNCVDPLMRSALIGNALYFGLVKKDEALRYDLELREISCFQLPPAHYNFELRVFATTEEGGLGLVTAHGDKIYMWSRKAGPPDAGWTQEYKTESLSLRGCTLLMPSGPHLVWLASRRVSVSSL